MKAGGPSCCLPVSRPRDIEPMLARSATALPAGERWAYEVKWDGFRALVHGDGRKVRLQSRKGNDLTPLFPELQELAALLRPGTVLDGEIVAFAGGKPDFELLQGRLGASGRKAAALAAAAPVRLVAFDLPVDAGASLLGVRWSERKERLQDLGIDGPRIWVPPHHLGPEGGALLQALTVEHGLEGVVAKRVDSRYEPGRRSGAWQKIKNWKQIELCVGGWVAAEDGGPASLLLGEPCADGLRYVAVGDLGLFGALRRALATTLPDLACAQRPFADVPRIPGARWVAPHVRLRCQYLERTTSGRLRHVLLLGLALPDASSAA